MKRLSFLILILLFNNSLFAICVTNYWHIDPQYAHILRYDVLIAGGNIYAYYFYVPTGGAFYQYQPVRIGGNNIYEWDGNLYVLAAQFPECFDDDILAACQINIAAIEDGKVVDWTNENGGVTTETINDLAEYVVPNITDADGDGIPDSYDMDSPLHDLYWQDCIEGGFLNNPYEKPGDFLDYLAWQTNKQSWVENNLNKNDSDGDGWTDGYENLHGFDALDPISKPPTGLGDAYPDQQYAFSINGMIAVDNAGNQNQQDWDNDGWSNGYELEYGYNPQDDSDYPDYTDLYPAGDWPNLDSDKDGITNIEDAQPYTFNQYNGFIYNSIGQNSNGDEIYVSTGYAGDTADPDFYTNQNSDYDVDDNTDDNYDGSTGSYSYNQNSFTFNDTAHDTLLQKFNKLIPSFDSIRPNNQSNYIVNIPMPIPGGNEKVFRLSILPDTTLPGGAALESMRCIIRLFIAALMTYVFIRNIWTVLRQY